MNLSRGDCETIKKKSHKEVEGGGKEEWER